MNAVQKLRNNDPCTLDEVVRRGGWAARRASSSGAAWGRAFNRSATRGKHARLGDVGSPATQFLATVHALETNDGTTSLPLLMEAFGMRKRLVIEKMSENVVREIAWDVVPDLAELLIKKRIDQKNL